MNDRLFQIFDSQMFPWPPEIVYTDGEWGTWTSWSICPVECGGGKTRRVRVCDNPKPKGGGSPCNLTIPLAENYPIKAAEIMECNPDPCPGKFKSHSGHVM